MSSHQDQAKSMLKLAQFKLFSSSEKRIDSNYIELILEGLDPNLIVFSTNLLEKYHRDLLGQTLLHLAYAWKNVDAFDTLIRKGADFNVKDKQGSTVLHKAFNYIISNDKSVKWNFSQIDSYTSSKIIPFIKSTLSAHIKHKNRNNPSDSDGLTHFHVACATNNVEAVEFFLNNKVPVDQVAFKATSGEYFEGYTGLHFAAQFGSLRVIEILLEHKANANLADAKGKAPMHIALDRNIAMIGSAEGVYSIEDIAGNEQVIHLLINLNIIEKFSYLCIASSLQSTTKLENYLTQDIDVNQCMNMDSQNWPGYTPLHFAAHVNVKAVKLLMKHGGNIEAKDANGVTPFDLCIERYEAKDIADIISLVPKWKNIVLSDRKTKLTDLLLAFKDSDEIQNFIQKSDENINLFVPFDSPLWPGFTILHMAILLSERTECKSDEDRTRIQQGYYKESYFVPDLSIITEILKQGADVTIKDHRNWTPVHLAFQFKRKKFLNLLLQYHYRMRNPVDNDNLSHLHIACAAQNQDFVERILRNDIDVNIPYKGKTLYESVFPGSTPLHVAFSVCNEKIARLLLKFGADPHIPDACTFTPLHFSMLTPLHFTMHEDCSKELGKRLFSSSNLSDHVVEKVGLSYLHVACFIPNLNAIKRLLDLGANVNQVMTVENLDKDSVYWKIWDLLKSRDGDTPLHTVLRSLHNSSDVISLLIERGGDILVRNAEGESPLEMILELGCEESAKVLVEALRRDVELRQRVKAETGVTVLHAASLMNDVDLIKELLDDGADVTAPIHEDKKFWPGLTALHVAYDKLCFSRYDLAPIVTQVSLLLKAHKNFEINPTEVAGISHFHIACHMLDVEVVEKFLKHNVDVNAAINVFYNAEIAGCSPLILALKTTKWRDGNLGESSAKLRIVKLLINHGARVNVEDIEGNTPAHYAAFCCSKDENYLKMFVENKADVNTRNVRGKTPLELLIGKRDFKLQDIRYFIACGCIFNEFTLDKEEGYIALVNAIFDPVSMENLFEEVFEYYPDSMKRDCMNRTAIHNLVSTEFYKTDEKKLAALVDVMMRFDCDADDQDDLGRTALHLTARFRNNIGAKAMLLVGADFSITDNNGKTPFAYIFQPCLCKIKDEDHEVSKHYKIFDVFMIYVRKMEISDLRVDELNRALVRGSIADVFTFDPERTYEILQRFRSEFQQMVQMKIEPYSMRLADFMSRAVAVFDYPRMSEAKREAIDAFFKRNRNLLRSRFPNAAGIFELQYRQAVLRRKMIVSAKDSLSVLARFHVPDVCSDVILQFLKNSELRKLITSTRHVEIKNVDIGSHCVIRSKEPRF